MSNVEYLNCETPGCRPVYGAIKSDGTWTIYDYHQNRVLARGYSENVGGGAVFRMLMALLSYYANS